MTALQSAIEAVLGLVPHGLLEPPPEGTYQDFRPKDFTEDGWDSDAADFIAAAVNLFRQHGPALVEAVRNSERYEWLRDRATQYQIADLNMTHNSRDWDYLIDTAIDSALAGGLASGEG